MPPSTPAEWNQRYADETTPWDSGLGSRELTAVLDELGLRSGRALELGCGTGTNAVLLARRGFEVTGVDVAPLAIERARARAAGADVRVRFEVADVTEWVGDVEPFDLVFDRGCFHCVRSTGLYGYLATLRRVTRPGTVAVFLAGNADSVEAHGPPPMTVEEIGRELSPMFELDHVRRFHFEDAGGVQGPLGWSILGRRR